MDRAGLGKPTWRLDLAAVTNIPIYPSLFLCGPPVFVRVVQTLTWQDPNHKTESPFFCHLARDLINLRSPLPKVLTSDWFQIYPQSPQDCVDTQGCVDSPA